MYPSFREVAEHADSSRVARRREPRRLRPRVPATVLLLGATSMLTDISSEMVTAVLPLYLTFELSFTALQFGLFDGLAQGVQTMVRIASGARADRRSAHKGLAMVGYGASAVSRLAMIFTAGAWFATTAVLLVDRVGKGIRTAPRDAMISLSSPPEMLGRSFGVHRALDALGALIGPLVAFAILAAIPDSYNTVFIVSFSFAMVGLAVLALFVQRRPRLANPVGGFRRLMAHDVIRNPALRRILIGATLLGAFTISDAFVYLGYRRVADISLAFFPLLFTGTALVYLVLAVPVGRLADRIGRRRVFLAGYGVMGLVYVSLVHPLPGTLGLLMLVGGLGLFYAATDGVLMAAASEVLGVETRATGLAIVATGTAVGRLVASVSLGALWSMYGPDTAFTLFALTLPLAVALSWWMMSRPVLTQHDTSVAQDQP